MSIVIKPRNKQRDYSGAAIGFVKSVASALPALLTADPLTAAKATGSSLSSLIDTVLCLGKDTSDQLDFSAYDVLNAAFASGLALFLTRIDLQIRPTENQLWILIEHQLEMSRVLMAEQECFFDLDAFESPLLLPPVRSASTGIFDQIKEFGPVLPPALIRKDFEESMFDGLKSVWIAKPELFKRIETALSGHFADVIDRRKAMAFHKSFVIRVFSQVPIFGQEDTGITINSLYVRQRCLWYKREDVKVENQKQFDEVAFLKGSELGRGTSKRVARLYVGDMHEQIDEWLLKKEPLDSVRVIAGGPGSGKSTFAKALMIDVIDSGVYDVLFVPLQEIEPIGNFETRIANLFKSRSDLGFDRVDSPLSWLAKSQSDATAPNKPLLLICDGLDEIAPPDTAEAANVTTDFIQALRIWISNRNAGGCYVKALVLGRDIAAREAFAKLGIDHEALLYVGGMTPIDQTEVWKTQKDANLISDFKDLAGQDQRVDYWRKWSLANKLDEVIPDALASSRNEIGAIQDLTAEPLLLYLLLWTGYLGDNWRKAAENRNVVYREIFYRIYKRDWGNPRIQSITGGHVGTRCMSMEQFLKLQEALGIASWQSGGRTVSKQSFEKVIKFYLDEDHQEDLRNDKNFSLKSIAMQSYARISDVESAGYEFVHKTLSEYLIGRGLFNICLSGLSCLTSRITDDRCKKAAKTIAQIAHSGVLSQEIDRFFADEVRLACAEGVVEPRSFLSGNAIPLINWILRHMMPVHDIALFNSSAGFAALDIAERRSLDVYWTFTQHLSRAAYKEENYCDRTEQGWQSGPIKIHWPSYSATSFLIGRLFDVNHVSESRRVCTFDRLDLSGQLFTELSLGAVLYESTEKNTRPARWFSFSSQGSLFALAEFYTAKLDSGNFSMSSFLNCRFVGADLFGVRFSRAHLDACDFSTATLTDVNFVQSSLSSVDFEGTGLESVNFVSASLVNISFAPRSKRRGHRRSRNSGGYIEGCNFDQCTLDRVRFSSASIAATSFKQSVFVDVDLRDATIEGCVINPAKAKKIVIDQSLHKHFLATSLAEGVLVFETAQKGKKLREKKQTPR